MKRVTAKADGIVKRRVPTIACFNRATVPLGVDFDKLIAALQKFVDEHVAPVWGTPAKLVKTNGFVRGCWAMVFIDHARRAHSLAFHDVTPEGLPQAKVFVETTLKNGKLVSVAASHELVEMLVDPAVNLVTMKRGSKLAYGYETADPVEDLTFRVDGILVTNFVYPAYFESFHKPGSVRFDHLGQLKRPFHIHINGYQGVCEDGKWTMRFGSRAKQKRFEQENRNGRRAERRAAAKHRRSSKKHVVHPPRSR
jgi:hypothetical protein